MEVWKQYQIEITNKSAALENLNDDEDVNRTWENIKEDIEISESSSSINYGLMKNDYIFRSKETG